MRQEHRFGIAVPDLFGADKNILLTRIYVEEKLGGVDDLVDGIDRMLSAYQRKKRHRIEDKQERTGNSEKVAHHQIRSPRRLKLRKTVENIKRVSAGVFDSVVDLNREILKAVRKRNIYRFNLGHVRYQRLVSGKAEIDYFALILDRLPHIRLHKKPELT